MMMATLQDPETGNKVRVPQADEYPGYEGWMVLVEEEWPTLAMLQDAVWARVKVIRETQLTLAPVTLDDGTATVAQTDTDSMVKINGLVSMAMLAQGAGPEAAASYSEVFTMADNSEATLNAVQMIHFGIAVGQHIAAVHARGRDLRTAIYGATTAADLDAIDITEGWP